MNVVRSSGRLSPVHGPTEGDLRMIRIALRALIFSLITMIGVGMLVGSLSNLQVSGWIIFVSAFLFLFAMFFLFAYRGPFSRRRGRRRAGGVWYGGYYGDGGNPDGGNGGSGSGSRGGSHGGWFGGDSGGGGGDGGGGGGDGGGGGW